MNKSKVAYKLYLSFLWPLIVLAVLGFSITITAVIHDQIIDARYSGDFFLATATWNHQSLSWDDLPEEHVKALKRVAGDDTEGHVLGPWIRYSGVRVDGSGKYNDEDLKRYFTDKYNDRFWGFKIPWLSWDSTDLHPIRTFAFALLFFLAPGILYLGKRWIVWLAQD